MKVDVRTGQGDVKLPREEFARRLRQRFDDPALAAVSGEVDRVVETAWKSYDEYRKNPRTRKAGAGFADPDFELPIAWLDPYATSHAALDADTAFQQETRNAARALVEAVALARAGRLPRPDRALQQPRPK